MNATAMTLDNPDSRERHPQCRRLPVAFHYTQTDSFVALLHELGASLLVSTYQANKLLAVRASGHGLSTLVRTFDRPMGLAVDGSRLAIGTRKEVWLLRNAPDIAPQVEPAGQHDACFLPRSSPRHGRHRHSRDCLGHRRDVSELWIVSTRFSCLATLSPDYSFVPRWRPPFISALAAEDRCHLNGLAIVDGEPRFVTALGTTDMRDGWRADKPHGGCIIDVPSGEFVTRGLSMPHSPRWHDGRLWVLESGTGRLVLVDPATGQRETRGASCPASPAVWRSLRAVRLRRPVEDSPDVRDGRRADGRAARGVEVRRGGGGLAQRPGRRVPGVPDRRGRDLRRATLARPALSRGDRIPARDDPAHVYRSAQHLMLVTMPFLCR